MQVFPKCAQSLKNCLYFVRNTLSIPEGFFKCFCCIFTQVLKYVPQLLSISYTHDNLRYTHTQFSVLFWLYIISKNVYPSCRDIISRVKSFTKRFTYINLQSIHLYGSILSANTSYKIIFLLLLSSSPERIAQQIGDIVSE